MTAVDEDFIKNLTQDETSKLDLGFEEWDVAGLPWWFLGNLRSNYTPRSNGSTDLQTNQVNVTFEQELSAFFVFERVVFLVILDHTLHSVRILIQCYDFKYHLRVSAAQICVCSPDLFSKCPTSIFSCLLHTST